MTTTTRFNPAQTIRLLLAVLLTAGTLTVVTSAPAEAAITTYTKQSATCGAHRNPSRNMTFSAKWQKDSSNGKVRLVSITVVTGINSTVTDWATSLTVADRNGTTNYSSQSNNPSTGVTIWTPTSSPWTAPAGRNAYARASNTTDGDCFPTPVTP